MFKGKPCCILYANLQQLTTHSLKPKASDSDFAFSSVTMSKSNIVKGVGVGGGNTVMENTVKKEDKERAVIPLWP